MNLPSTPTGVVSSARRAKVEMEISHFHSVAFYKEVIQIRFVTMHSSTYYLQSLHLSELSILTVQSDGDSIRTANFSPV